jgi:RNA polymerase sigma-70 factor, ECF subfamily
MPNRPFPFPRRRASLAAVPMTIEDDFTETVQQHRGELHRHCLRLLGSHADAEDALQETLLRAWRARRKQTHTCPRGWLYAIATNACYDVIARRRPTSHLTEVEPAAPATEEPHARLLERETVELALLTAIQHLPPLQQTSFIMRDVLNLSAEDTAAALQTSLPATNSALQRARRGLRERLPPNRIDWMSKPPCAADRHTLRRYLKAVDAPNSALASRFLCS